MKITENAVENAIIRFMQSLGWRASRNHVGLFQRMNGSGKIKVGTEGFPDWTFIRKTTSRGANQLMHVEVKAPGKKPTPKQFEVMASLNHIGELSVWADSLDAFKAVYFQNFIEDLERAA